MSEQSHSGSAIEVRDLSYRYEGSAESALKELSLFIERGTCFGLLGPNGAGKTTLLSILTGMLPCQSGQVEVEGMPLSKADDVKRISAIVPQDLAFYPGLTGRENLVFFAGLHGLKGDRREQAIAEAVATCQLQDFVRKRAETYSGGLKRRLNLAIGLLNKPRVLYLDEPTVGIDAQSRNFILEAIRKLKAGGMTIVYTSHYMEEVQAICDELAIVDHGQIVLQSRLADLLDDQRQILDLSLREPASPEQLAQLADLGECKSENLRLRIYLPQEQASIDGVLERIKAARLQPRQIQYGMNRLEDIYLSITRHDLRE